MGYVARGSQIVGGRAAAHARVVDYYEAALDECGSRLARSQTKLPSNISQTVG
jgi:hypothetical protein